MSGLFQPQPSQWKPDKSYDSYYDEVQGTLYDPARRQRAVYNERTGSPMTLGPYNPYRGDIAAAQEAEMAQAQALYGAAGAAGGIRGAQLRGEGMRQTLGDVYGGNALASRQALYGTAQASYGGGLEGTRQASADRLAAAEAVMGAQQKRATYEQAAYQRWLEYQQQQQAAEDILHGVAQQKRQTAAAESAAEQKFAGSLMGGVGSMAAGGQ